MKKTVSGYVIPIVAFLLSALLQLASSTTFFDGFIKTFIVEGKVTHVKSIIDIVSYFVFAIPIGIQAIVRTKKAGQCREILIKYKQKERESLNSKLISQGLLVGGQNAEDCINVRVFKRRFNRLVLDEQPGFYNKEINGKLSFSIKRNEGLCVQAYKKGQTMMEKEDGSKSLYNLTIRQKALAGELQFIVAVPIVPDGNKTVSRVICFDSFQRIAKNGCEERILKICEPYAYMIDSMI